MIKSFIVTEDALILTLKETTCTTEFTSQDWKLMRKVINVLQPFKEATIDLSNRDASISMCIPTVTTIISALDVSHEDHGVMAMKRSLQANMEERFCNMEYNRHYTVATLLDSKFKGCFYRDPDTLSTAKEYLTEELVQLLREEGPNDEVRCLNWSAIGHTNWVHYSWAQLETL